MYIVKIGYKLLVHGNSELQKKLPTHMTTFANNFFSNLWALQLPDKIKITTWKIYNDFIPMYANLNKRHITIHVLCLLCQIDLESIDHLLGFCSVTSQILTFLQIIVPPMSNHLDYKSWLVEVFQTTDDRNRKLVTLIVWSIWLARNKIIHEGIRQTMNDLVVFILGYLTKSKP